MVGAWGRSLPGRTPEPVRLPASGLQTRSRPQAAAAVGAGSAAPAGGSNALRSVTAQLVPRASRPGSGRRTPCRRRAVGAGRSTPPRVLVGRAAEPAGRSSPVRSATVLSRVVRRAADDHAEVAAYVASDGWTVTYRELDQLSDEAAAAFARRGIGTGSVVALSLPSTADYIVAYLAAAKIGAVTAGLNPRFRGPERQAALDGARTRPGARRRCAPRRCGRSTSTSNSSRSPTPPARYSPISGTPGGTMADLARRSRPPGVHLLHIGQHRRPQGRVVHQPAAAGHRRPRHRRGLGRRRPPVREHRVRTRRRHDQAAVAAGHGRNHAPARPSGAPNRSWS